MRPATRLAEPEFDKEWAVVLAGRIIEDIDTADERFTSSYPEGAATTMEFLFQDMQDLLAEGIPDVGRVILTPTVTRRGQE